MNGRLAALTLAATLAAGAPARAQGMPTVRVHLEGDPRAVLQMRWAGERYWDDVCQAPCDIRVPLEASYRVNGDGIQQSRRFTLPSTYGDVHLDVLPASSGTHVFGILTLALGAGSFGAGLITMLVSLMVESCPDCVGGFASTTAPNIAWAMMGAGALSMIAGGVIMAETKTLVDISTASQVHATVSATSVVPERRAVTLPPAVGVPIVGVSF